MSLKLDKTHTLENWRSETKAAAHILIISVESYESHFPDHASLKTTTDELNAFWLRVASGGAPFSLDKVPVATVTVLRLGKDQASSPNEVLTALVQATKIVRAKDQLIVHWTGHGISPGAKDHLLILPRLSDPNNRRSLQGFSLQRFIEWMGLNVKAKKFFFFFDCCSLRPAVDEVRDIPPDLPQIAPEHDARVVERKQMYILVGSGDGRSAFGPQNRPRSLFCDALISTLESYPARLQGYHDTGPFLTNLIAAHIQSSFMRDDAPGLPTAEQLGENRLWKESFLMEITPHRREYSRWDDDQMIGRTEKINSLVCVWFIDDEGLPNLTLAHDAKQHDLSPIVYKQETYQKAKMIGLTGEVARNSRIRVDLKTNEDVLVKEEWDDGGPLFRSELIVGE